MVVWIEILNVFARTLNFESLPTRECGLKYLSRLRKCNVVCVTPYAGVWIEMMCTGAENLIRTSLPTRECGLKYFLPPYEITRRVSLPTRECGLKFLRTYACINGRGVTPYAGVWIEI